MPITMSVDATPVAVVRLELVADGRAEVLRELGADDDVERPHVVRPAMIFSGSAITSK